MTPKTPTNLNQAKDSWKGELQVQAGSQAAQLTDQELLYVDSYVGNGGDAKAAA
jgi:hypothetical protein